MSRQIKFRIWNRVGDCMHEWKELVAKNKIHLLSDQQYSYPVMQFTGLLDVNGKEIYEGDIISIWGTTLKVYWEDSDASFMAETLDDNAMCESGQEWSGRCEVIGNIYENPELLEEN